ncbi:hypothetical protein VNO78_09937 [Psophocarpus tetragonolobus]|uniref:Uncharacterized protein n=1 Tax=Psophocarpus tetragonolobus TaxID=3891 RepID=A0AAN9SIY0_PSOTE
MKMAASLGMPVAVTVKELSPTRRMGKLKVKLFGFEFDKKRVNVGNANCSHGAYDYELRSVLELATDSELHEIEAILFGTSYLSPLLKSIPFPFTNTDEVDRSMIGVDLQLRQQFIAALESRFFFLAADARSTLRGWRPSYRNVLLQIRKKLNIPCSLQLATHDLELEIFLHLLHCNSSELDSGNATTLSDGLQRGFSQWKVQSKLGAEDIRSIIFKLIFLPFLFKGGGVFTLSKIYQLLARKLSGKVLVEAANYQVKKELVNKGGQLAMINLESRAALLAAKQGFLGAASRYLGFRSMITLLGPVLWGTFLADLVIQMLGTDYARILRTIYALAQIRVIRTYQPPSDVSDE